MEQFIKDTDPRIIAVGATFLLSFLIQAIYYLFYFSRAAKKPDDLEKTGKEKPSVSIIICARNEGESLKQNLASFLEQDYPLFEVVVVNDCSEDKTDDVLDEFALKYKHLKVSSIKKDPKFSHGKKLALTIGIKAAKHDILLLSDADCRPAGDQWINYMVRNYRKDIEVVLGVGLYRKRKGLLNLLIRLETAFIAMQYISLARAGKPYMGVGRNLSYTKELFFRNKGFASHYKLDSGDDDLFINEVSHKKNTRTETHPASFTWSEPEKTLRDWLRQKKRHLTTGKLYQQQTKWLLGLEYLTRALLVMGFITLLLLYPDPIPVLAVYILAIIIKSLIYIFAFKRFGEKFLFLPAIIVQELTPFFYSVIHIINFIEKKKT